MVGGLAEALPYLSFLSGAVSFGSLCHDTSRFTMFRASNWHCSV